MRYKTTDGKFHLLIDVNENYFNVSIHSDRTWMNELASVCKSKEYSREKDDVVWTSTRVGFSSLNTADFNILENTKDAIMLATRLKLIFDQTQTSHLGWLQGLDKEEG